MEASVRNSLLFLPAIPVLFACEPGYEAANFESKASIVQSIDVADAKVASFVFGCSSFSVNRRWDAKEVKLEIDGNYSIHGYQGTLEEAGAHPIDPNALEFKVSRVGDTVVVDSPEWQVIHHALSVERLRVTVPTEMAVKLECLTYQQLETRGRAR